MRSSCSLSFGLVVILILPVLGEDPSATFNSLPEIEFSQLSQRDPNPLGRKRSLFVRNNGNTRRPRKAVNWGTARTHHPSLLRRRSDCKVRLQPRCQTLLALAQKFKIAPRKRIDFEFAFANVGSAVTPPVRSAVGGAAFKRGSNVFTPACVARPKSVKLAGRKS